ncbi:hypothetical protein P22_0708 [Propionispora sp. 2/2-37]|uniref:hypothetical protein n=1 Tax=Propionispora sp. 2/2-37 TaxID=1677858 RepID=UPI0006BB733E|nr:hypothetical protein [Propionispora sp. 2/2-37]CUH94642.1 hypothetical protein P22_0708 [Propionispora sp. 2/2-37]
MCKYDNYLFWEGALARKQDLWQSTFGPLASAEEAVFVNTAIVDYRRNMLDNNWACYANSKSLLGFVQYVYLPLAFYYTIHQDNEQLFIPLCSRADFLEYVRNSGSGYAPLMEAALNELDGYWNLDDAGCLGKMKMFCIDFNLLWNRSDFVLHVRIYSDTMEVAQDIIDSAVFPEVLEEDTGLTVQQLRSMCRNFYDGPFMQKNFIKILNNKVGCIV